MKTITLKNISKSYQTRTLFNNVSFSVTKGDRIAITGKNGAGKSTLLKIIANLEEFDSGALIKEKVTCEYISQEFTNDTSLSILEYLDVTQATTRVFDIIKQFRVIGDAQIEEGYVHELSGGQKRVLEIAGVLSKSPMFLCIDEPENHLDIKTRVVLTDILKQYWGAVLFVSHDRYLINEIATKIFALKDLQGTLVSGKSYEEFVAAQQQQVSSSLAYWKAENKALEKLKLSVRMLKARTRYSDAQAKTYQMKLRELERRRKVLGARPDIVEQVHIDVEEVRHKNGKLILACHDLHFAYPGSSAILEKVHVDLRFGEKVVLLGRNGSGKTTFLNLLKKIQVPTSGEVRLGVDLDIQYVDQLSTLDVEMSPLEHFRAKGFDEERARSILSQFLFSQSEVGVSLKTLSGGQQQRFTFLFLFKTHPECIVMDEPTNNLDPSTWDLLLQLLNEYTGSLLLISHDRIFVEQLKNKKIWVLKNKTIKESWSDIDTILKDL